MYPTKKRPVTEETQTKKRPMTEEIQTKKRPMTEEIQTKKRPVTEEIPAEEGKTTILYITHDSTILNISHLEVYIIFDSIY